MMIFRLKFIDTNNDLFPGFNIFLVFVSTAGNFILYKSLFNCRYATTQ